MYHPTRGGVRGGRDQFSWEDVKADKHRENFLGHSIKAPVGRWQKGKDLHWYTRDKKSQSSDDALKDEIQRIKEEEEQAMREALGLAPKRASRPQGNRLDKHELSELVKRGSTAEDVGAGHAEAAWVHGLGFTRAPRAWEDPSTLQSSLEVVPPEMVKPAVPNPPVQNPEKDESQEDNKRKERSTEIDELKDESNRKKKRREEKKHEKHERREKRHSHNSDDKRKHRKDKEKRRHDSD
ncbi:hypothetical protein ACOSP7_033054 [Xanthoceras sorbifolium]